LASSAGVAGGRRGGRGGRGRRGRCGSSLVGRVAGLVSSARGGSAAGVRGCGGVGLGSVAGLGGRGRAGRTVSGGGWNRSSRTERAGRCRPMSPRSAASSAWRERWWSPAETSPKRAQAAAVRRRSRRRRRSSMVVQFVTRSSSCRCIRQQTNGCKNRSSREPSGVGGVSRDRGAVRSGTARAFLSGRDVHGPDGRGGVAPIPGVGTLRNGSTWTTGSGSHSVRPAGLAGAVGATAFRRARKVVRTPGPSAGGEMVPDG